MIRFVSLQYSPITKPQKVIKPHYNVVIIGSGYGGGVAACRGARGGQSVCVFEKGLEYLPGDFPETMEESFRSTYVSDERANRSFGVFQVFTSIVHLVLTVLFAA